MSKLHIVEDNTGIQLLETELVVMPGIGTRLELPPESYEKAIEFCMNDRRTSYRVLNEKGEPVSREFLREMLKKTFSKSRSFVCSLSHCPITGDTKAYVGDRPKERTNSSIVKSSNKSRGSREDDNFTDYFLAGLAVTSILD